MDSCPHDKQSKDHAAIQNVLILRRPPLNEPHYCIAHAERVGDVQHPPLRPLQRSEPTRTLRVRRLATFLPGDVLVCI